MKAVVQRVRGARVRVRDEDGLVAPTEGGAAGDGEIVGEIGLGLLVLLGIARGDDEPGVTQLARRIAELRCFADEQGRMNLAAAQVSGAMLVVSQFTLVADVGRGRRPSFDTAEDPARAKELVEHFIGVVRSLGLPVASGRFGAHMEVELLNDGPVTFVFEG